MSKFLRQKLEDKATVFTCRDEGSSTVDPVTLQVVLIWFHLIAEMIKNAGKKQRAGAARICEVFVKDPEK